MGNYKINKYPDGSSYVDISVFNKVITYRINSYEDLWHLKQITDAYQKSGLIPCITIPNLFDGQADRRFADNQSNGLKLVCEFLNTMYATFKIFHPHNPEVVEALVNDVEIIDNTNFITGVLFDLGKTYPDRLQDEYCKTNQGFYFDKRVADNTILMSSDAGGFKPLMKLCDKISWSGETFSASKSRTFEEGASKLTQKLNRKDFEGKDILIVDDISVYGGTFKGLAKMLKERNCGKLYLAVSHMTVQHLGKDPVTDYFDKVFTTNSKYEVYYDGMGLADNLEVVKLF